MLDGFGRWAVDEISNQSTGCCPDVSSRRPLPRPWTKPGSFVRRASLTRWCSDGAPPASSSTSCARRTSSASSATKPCPGRGTCTGPDARRSVACPRPRRIRRTQRISLPSTLTGQYLRSWIARSHDSWTAGIRASVCRNAPPDGQNGSRGCGRSGSSRSTPAGSRVRWGGKAGSARSAASTGTATAPPLGRHTSAACGWTGTSSNSAAGSPSPGPASCPGLSHAALTSSPCGSDPEETA